MEIKNSRTKWDAIYEQQDSLAVTAADVLIQNTHLLPSNGKALDLACGLGGNAVVLARHKLDVQAWDISEKALEKLKHYSAHNELTIEVVLCDVEKNPPQENTFDVIVVSHFLHRPTFPKLLDSLKPNGLLFYQTFIRDKVEEIGPSNSDYLLGKNELLNFCQGLEVLVYREEGKQGDGQKGWRNKAMIVAKKS